MDVVIACHCRKDDVCTLYSKLLYLQKPIAEVIRRGQCEKDTKIKKKINLTLIIVVETGYYKYHTHWF